MDIPRDKDKRQSFFIRMLAMIIFQKTKDGFPCQNVGSDAFSLLLFACM